MSMIDLHMHSTASDGSLAPEALLDQCAKIGLTMCSVTDHDCADAQVPAKSRAARLSLDYLTGIELSAQHEGELHILGYGCDIWDEAFRSQMEELRQYRVSRTWEILSRLDRIGIHLPLEEVTREAGGNTIGRPHVALALVKNGHASSYQEAFDKFLNYGGLCYVNRRKLDARQAIELIRNAGGTAVLAHPGLIATDDLEGEVRRLADMGIEGIEAFYPSHPDDLVRRCLSMARSMNLLVTCGSDYHGPFREGAIGRERRHDPLLASSAAILRQKYLQ